MDFDTHMSIFIYILILLKVLIIQYVNRLINYSAGVDDIKFLIRASLVLQYKV